MEMAYPAALGTRTCCACSEKAPAERAEELAASCAAAGPATSSSSSTAAAAASKSRLMIRMVT